ncbi:MAG: hypothetical protein QME14_03180 [Methanobacteriaceae archaeon]|nr:hypothetical protein [Methanobacteriaceae archaeon]
MLWRFSNKIIGERVPTRLQVTVKTRNVGGKIYYKTTILRYRGTVRQFYYRWHNTYRGYQINWLSKGFTPFKPVPI